MTRERYIADLRTLADLLERNPSLPLPASMPGPLPVAVVNVNDINLSRDEIETLREAVRTIVAEETPGGATGSGSLRTSPDPYKAKL